MSGQPEAPRGTKRADIHWVYLSTIYFLLAGTVFYLYLARVLPPSELGGVVILQAIATVVSACVALGLGSGFQHFLSFYQGRKEPEILRILLRGSLSASAVLALVGFALTFALSGELGSLLFRSSTYGPTIALLGVYAGLTAALAILQGVVLGLQRFALYSARSMVTYTVTYSAAVLFLARWPGVRSIVGGWILGASVGCFLYLIAVLRARSPGEAPAPAGRRSALPSLPLYRSVLAYSIPIFIATLLTTSATYVDRLVLASISNLASVGYYNYALLIVGGSGVVAAPFGTILLPKISEHLGRNDTAAIRSVTRTSTSLVVLVYVPFALALAALGPFLLRILVGPAFVQDSLPMAVLLILTAVAIPSSILGSLAAGTRRTSALMKASAVALGANAALSILLVPRIGILGAAIGNSAMSWGLLIVLALELRGTRLIDVDMRSVSRVWAASAVMAVAIGLPLFRWGYGTAVAVASAALGLAVLLVAFRLARAVPADATDFLLHVLPSRLRFLRRAVCWVSGCEGCRHSEWANPTSGSP